MIRLLLALLCITNGEFIHTEQGVYSNPYADIEFDKADPIASHPDMQSLIQEVYDRNVRRGLTNPSTLSTTDKQVILDLHNKIRSETARGLYEGPGGNTQPQSCNMNALSWSVALETLATEWSSQCYFEHSRGCIARMASVVSTESLTTEWQHRPTRDGCGENLYISGAAPALNAKYGNTNYGMLGGIEDGWSKEESLLYTYQKGFVYDAGHYTQMIWANTRYVGCGFRQCNGITTDTGSYSWGKLMFTCNYYPPGNYNNQYPYQVGTPCSCCDDDRKACSHNGGLCGGGWSSTWNINKASTVDRCDDGLGRNVCSGDTPSANATPRPTPKPTPSPSKVPTKRPSDIPTIRRITDMPTMADDDQIRYAIRVSNDIIWLTYSYDYDGVSASIEELMFQILAEPYLGLTSANVDESAMSSRGPFCANPCHYIYGFNTVPMVLQGATMAQMETIVAMVKETKSYETQLCEALTAMYKDGNDRGLRCYRVTASVESVTESAYQKFIGDLESDEVSFNTLNLESYSGADIFVLFVFLALVCCICWCVGWYSHKKRFQSELKQKLSMASSYNPEVHEMELRKQMTANESADLLPKGIGRIYKSDRSTQLHCF